MSRTHVSVARVGGDVTQTQRAESEPGSFAFHPILAQCQSRARGPRCAVPPDEVQVYGSPQRKTQSEETLPSTVY